MRLIVGTDTETTGFAPGDHRIVEAYVGVYDLDTRTKLTEYFQRINPERSMPADAQRVHGISIADLAGEPNWSIVAPNFAKALNSGLAIVAHNGEDFDMPFINYEMARIGLPKIERPLIDTMKQARWATPIGKSPSLGELAFACEVEYDATKAHAANYDVDVMMACFFRGLEWGFFELPEIAA